MGPEETKERQHLISISKSPFSFGINFECGTSYRLCWNSISSNNIHLENGGSDVPDVHNRMTILIFTIVVGVHLFEFVSKIHWITYLRIKWHFNSFIDWNIRQLPNNTWTNCNMIYWLLHWLLRINTTKIYTLKINK